MRRPTLNESNRLFTAVMIGWGGAVGSLISFLFTGAILWAFIRLYQDKIALPTNRSVIFVAIAFMGFVLANFLSAIANFEGAHTLIDLVPNLLFLGFLPVYGRLSLSRRGDVLSATEFGVVTGGLGAFVFAVVQTTFFGETRAEGLAGNPGPFALISAVLYGLSILVLLRHQGWMRAVAALAVLGAASAVMLSGMRTLWPILLLGPVAPFVLYRSEIGARSMRHLAVIVAGVIVVSGMIGYDIARGRVQSFLNDYDSVTTEFDFDNSLGYRLRMWSEGLERAAEKPILGHGPTHVKLGIGKDLTVPTLDFSHYHNFVIDALVQSGFVGLLATLYMLLAPVIVAARRSRDEIGDAGLAMLITVAVAYLLSGSFNIMLGHDILDALFVYSYIVGTYLVFGGRAPTSAADMAT